MSRFWSDTVHNLTPYSPGEQPQIDNLIKLNTNENPYGPSPAVIKAIADANNNNLRKYPDPNSTQLKNAIASNFDLSPAQVFVANSSDEVLAHAFRAFFQQSKSLLVPDISYSFYTPLSNLLEIDCQSIPLRADFTLNIKDYLIDDLANNGGIVFANPNAPTGIAVSIDEIEALLQANTDSVVLIDEAYADFADDSAVRLIDKYPNLLVTQTLSKSRSLAGLRVGLALGNKQLIEGLERVKNSFHPYPLSRLALAGATAAFKDNDYFDECIAKVVATRDTTSKALATLGFNVLPSATNFLFATHPDHQAKNVFMALRERSIIIRYFDTARIDNYLRISVGTDVEMTQLIAALKEILATPSAP